MRRDIGGANGLKKVWEGNEAPSDRANSNKLPE